MRMKSRDLISTKMATQMVLIASTGLKMALMKSKKISRSMTKRSRSHLKPKRVTIALPTSVK